MNQRSWSRCACAAVLACSLAACGYDWEPRFDETIDSEALGSVAIAGAGDALTFARVERDGAYRALAVQHYDNHEVEGVDLSAALSMTRSRPSMSKATTGSWLQSIMHRRPQCSPSLSVNS